MAPEIEAKIDDFLDREIEMFAAPASTGAVGDAFAHDRRTIRRRAISETQLAVGCADHRIIGTTVDRHPLDNAAIFAKEMIGRRDQKIADLRAGGLQQVTIKHARGGRVMAFATLDD